MDKRVVIAFLPEPPYLWNANRPGQRLVCILLASEHLGVVSNVCELYGDLLAQSEIGP